MVTLLLVGQLFQSMEQSLVKQQKGISQIRSHWNQFAPYYSSTDFTINTNYYSLLSFLELGQANHILQVGCGPGKLVPMVLSLKPKECSFLVTDLSPVMVDHCSQNMKQYHNKIGIKGSFEEWCRQHTLSIEEANGEEPFNVGYRFDRIIANLVVHHTQNPLKMMTNLHSVAAQGCLLAVSIIGEDRFNDFRRYAPEAHPNEPRKYVPNLNKLIGMLRSLGEETGWQVLVQWKQNAPFMFRQEGQNLRQFISNVAREDEATQRYIYQRSLQKLRQRKALEVATELIIYRKK